jgi:NAD(P)H dehydrogenase (quinone)
MNIGIIIHSHTGNTLAVGEKLKDTLLAAGHQVRLERVTAVNEDPSARTKIVLESAPAIGDYDAVIFGAPVRAFSLSPVMKAYLQQLPDMQGKKAGAFVTEFFPFPWMGGNQAIGQLKKACAAKGIQVNPTGVVNWSNKKREAMIADVVSRLGTL